MKRSVRIKGKSERDKLLNKSSSDGEEKERKPSRSAILIRCTYSFRGSNMDTWFKRIIMRLVSLENLVVGFLYTYL